MSVWTTSTTGLETALAAAIGSTIQQHTNTITNNLKGQAHILHIGNSISSGSVGSNLHHLSHTSANSNINVNQLQHHHHPPPSHHHNSNSSPHHSYNSKLWFCSCRTFIKFDEFFEIRSTIKKCPAINRLNILISAHNNIQQSILNRSAGTICSNHSKVSRFLLNYEKYSKKIWKLFRYWLIVWSVSHRH